MRRVTLERLAPQHVALLRAVLDHAAPDAVPVLVGGAVRDLVRRRKARVTRVDLGRAASGVSGAARDGARTLPATSGAVDIDVAVRHGALTLARRVADALGGSFVALDVARGAARVLVDGARLDITDFRAPTLEADLRARDFTVNALAVPLGDLLARGRAPIVDPTGGLSDLAARCLRLASPHALEDDPVRALRGVRFEAELGLTLAPSAARAIRAVAPRLAAVSAERVREELLVILRVPATGRALRRLDALGPLRVVVPEVDAMRATSQPRPHRFGVLEHSLRAVEAADTLVRRLDVMGTFGDELARHLSEPLGGGFRRADVLKLSALLHDVSKPETRALVRGRVRFFEHDVVGARRVRAVGERLKLPERVVAVLERLVRHHLRPMHLAQAGEITRRARYRFFRDLGDDARDLLLLTLVDAAAVTGTSPLVAWRRSAVVRDLIAGWPESEAATTAPPLVRGEDVMTRFALAPGPDVGRLLARAREAQDLGLVHTREEALAWLEAAQRTGVGVAAPDR